MNDNLLRGFDTSCKNKIKRVEGIFYKLSEKMRMSPVNMCIEYAPEARAADRIAISKQRSTKRRKEYLLHDKTVLGVSEEYIDELYYNDMFYSASCWNTDAAVDMDLEI